MDSSRDGRTENTALYRAMAAALREFSNVMSLLAEKEAASFGKNSTVSVEGSVGGEDKGKRKGSEDFERSATFNNVPESPLTFAQSNSNSSTSTSSKRGIPEENVPVMKQFTNLSPFKDGKSYGGMASVRCESPPLEIGKDGFDFGESCLPSLGFPHVGALLNGQSNKTGREMTLFGSVGAARKRPNTDYCYRLDAHQKFLRRMKVSEDLREREHNDGYDEKIEWPFAFEIPDEAWYKKSDLVRNTLLREGQFHHRRLCLMKCIFLVFQAKEGVQITLAKGLEIPHGQVSVVNRQVPKETSVPVKIIAPSLYGSASTIDSTDEFIKSWVIQQPQELDFGCLRKLVLDNAHTNNNDDDHAHRQSLYIDYGFSGGQANTVVSSQGICGPAMLRGSNDELVSYLFQVVSNLIKTHCPGIWPGVDKERLKRFAHQLHIENIVEFIRIAVTAIDGNQDGGGTCHLHSDTKNGKHSEVITFSKMIEVGEGCFERVVVICCMRKSIDDFIFTSDETLGPAVDYVTHSVSKLPRETKYPKALIASLNWEKPTGTYRNRKYMEVDCHLDNGVFYSSAINVYLKMYIKFQLDLIELMCLIKVRWLMPNYTFFFVSECEDILQGHTLPMRGLRFGYWLFRKVLDAYENWRGDKKKIPGTRSSIYGIPAEVDPHVFESNVIHMTLTTLRSWEHIERPSRKEERKRIYRRVFRAYKEPYSAFGNTVKSALPLCGELYMNHFLGEMSMLGTVPSWFSNEFFGNTESEGIKHLKSLTNWVGESGNNTLDTEKLLASISRGISMKCDMTCDLRLAESATCKIFRTNKKESTRFQDILWAGALLFIGVKKGVEVIVPGSEVKMIEGPLINHWSFNGQMHTTAELHGLLNAKCGGRPYTPNVLGGFEFGIDPSRFFCVSSSLFLNI